VQKIDPGDRLLIIEDITGIATGDGDEIVFCLAAGSLVEYVNASRLLVKLDSGEVVDVPRYAVRRAQC
jgi:hypothetical protein